MEAWPDGRDAATESTVIVDPVDALERIATLLERERAGRYKEEAFRKAADAIRDRPVDELRELAAQGRSATSPASGRAPPGSSPRRSRARCPSTWPASRPKPRPTPVPAPRSAPRSRATSTCTPTGPTAAPPSRQMARKAAELGHDYIALTDHSPSLTHRPRPRRRAAARPSSSWCANLNEELAPFRILTGIEVDILDDGRLDQDDDLLAELDVVVASVHSKLRMSEQPMTDRMVAAMANPQHRHPRPLHRPHGRWARAGPSRRSTPTSCSACARTSTRRSRSTAGPSGSTRRCACSSRWSARGVQGVDRQRRPRRRASSSGSPTGVPGRPRPVSTPTTSSTPGPSTGCWSGPRRTRDSRTSSSSRAGTGERAGRSSGITDVMPVTDDDPRWLAVLPATTATTSCTPCARRACTAGRRARVAARVPTTSRSSPRRRRRGRRVPRVSALSTRRARHRRAGGARRGRMPTCSTTATVRASPRLPRRSASPPTRCAATSAACSACPRSSTPTASASIGCGPSCATAATSRARSTPRATARAAGSTSSPTPASA